MNKIGMTTPPLNTQNDFLMFSIHRITHAMAMRADNELEKFGLSRAKMWALMQIRFAEEPIGISQLAECIGSGKSNATQLVDRMEAEGLVRRIQNAKDRRSVQLEVTEEGMRRMDEADKMRQEIIEDIFSPLSAKERESLLAMLDKLGESLDMPLIPMPLK